jgi:hypothetical protein
MSTLSPQIIHVFAPFAILFSCSKTWSKIALLITGAILCKGGRTVCSSLRVLGLQGEQAFENYHRVLNRAKWSALEGAKILLLQIIKALNIKELVVSVDDHVERRNGKKIKAKGCYRDAVRSSRGFVVRCFGLKWVAMMITVKFPWSQRTFALPFFTVLAPSEKANSTRGKKHKTTVDWARQMCFQLRRWLPEMLIILVADGGFASAQLAWTALRLKISLISRLRLDARIFDFPEIKSGPGRPAKRGRRLLPPKHLLKCPNTPWKEAEVWWYEGRKQKIQYATTACLWSPVGGEPVPIRLVVMRDPAGRFEPAVLMSTNVELSAVRIIEEFVKRWSIEVTFREVREHLGVETQRQWSDKAIARETPSLFGLYSIVILIGLKLEGIMVQKSAWYSKQRLTFSDILIAVRRLIWKERYFSHVTENSELKEMFSREEIDTILDRLADVM